MECSCCDLKATDKLYVWKDGVEQQDSKQVFQTYSKKIKNSVKSAVKFINNFEQTAADIAIENQYDFVVCGHIHQPEMREISNDHGKTMYLNSGDWIENLTALEYLNNEWSIYRFTENEIEIDKKESTISEEDDLNDSELFDNLVEEFNLMRQK